MNTPININDTVKVKLTFAGVKRFNEHYHTYNGAAFDKSDSEGYLTLQVHELMNIFGDMMVIWAKEHELPFVNNEIIHVREEQS